MKGHRQVTVAVGLAHDRPESRFPDSGPRRPVGRVSMRTREGGRLPVFLSEEGSPLPCSETVSDSALL